MEITLSAMPGLFNNQQQVIGCKEFQEYREFLNRADSILSSSGIEAEFAQLHLRHVHAAKQEVFGDDAVLSSKEINKYSDIAIKALRCNIVGCITGMALRPLSVRLAESSYLQNFCRLGDFQKVKIPGKSQLGDFRNMFPVEDIQRVMDTLLKAAANGESLLDLADPLDLADVYIDSTCLMANIHFPVDWLLLRDGCQTVLKAIVVIRNHGLKHRMPAPHVLQRDVNRLSIEMTNHRRKKDAKKLRRQTLRKLLKLTRVIEQHATRYCTLLEDNWQETSLGEGEVQQILKRLNSMIEQLPEARRQARSRIISQTMIPNDEKILSLYDEDVNVVKRGKMSAEVEFGNELFLAEQKDGLIVDWKLYRDSATSDTGKFPEFLARTEEKGITLKSVTADRGFDSGPNRDLLSTIGAFNGLCARNPDELREKMRNNEYADKQRRRGETEGRIAIVKNNFLGGRAASRDFSYRERQTAWAILAHNIWVITRLPRAGDQSNAAVA